MRITSGVFARGAILVAIPIVLQFIFVGWLAIVLADAQKKLQAQWTSEELIRRACQLSRDTTDVIVFMQMPPDVKDLIGEDVSSAAMDRPMKDYYALLELVRFNPEHRNALEHLQTYGLTLFKLQKRELEVAEQLKRRQSHADEMHRKPPIRLLSACLAICRKNF
ncbi:MAG: hypothetical protein IT342_14210 [Candidatus Melainabacteria bacterium]|nr:hypothetical protein [Candidatus Melainabacteria bacterium]